MNAGRGSVHVAFAADDDVGAPVEVGIVLARERRARLSVIGIARELAPSWCCGPTIARMSLRMDLGVSAARIQSSCREALRAVVTDVPADYRVVRGRPPDVVAAAIATGDFVTVVVPRSWMGSRRMRRAARAWQAQGIPIHGMGRPTPDLGVRTEGPTRPNEVARQGGAPTSAIGVGTIELPRCSDAICPVTDQRRGDAGRQGPRPRHPPRCERQSSAPKEGAP